MPTDLTQQVIQVIATHLHADASKITRETRLEDFGADSLQLVEIIMELEEKFDIEIEMNAGELWESLRDVGSIVDRISKLAPAKA